MEFLLEGRNLFVYFDEVGEHRKRAIQAMGYLTTEELSYPAGDDSIVSVELAKGIDINSAVNMIKDTVAGRRSSQINVTVSESYL